MSGYIDLGPECFTNEEKTVIGYQGMNFYRSCDEFVSDLEDGGQSFCVKRIGHPGNEHEDFDGRKTLGHPDVQEVR